MIKIDVDSLLNERVRVIPYGGNWVVKRVKNKEEIEIFKSKEEALLHAKCISDYVVVYNKNGTKHFVYSKSGLLYAGDVNRR